LSALLGRRRVLVAIILVLVAVVATESVVLAAATVRQGDVRYMKVATTTDYASTQSLQLTDVPGTALAMPIPSGEHDFFQITFTTAEVDCFKKTIEAGPAGCYVRALVDGQEVAPGPVNFGYSDLSEPDRLPQTMQWVSNVLAPGMHYVKIQFATSLANNGMSIYARTMTVVRVRAY
jgi:hypothetical protein